MEDLVTLDIALAAVVVYAQEFCPRQMHRRLPISR